MDMAWALSDACSEKSRLSPISIGFERVISMVGLKLAHETLYVNHF